MEILEDLPVAQAHPGWTEQILENSLSNAEKYCPPGEPISVRADLVPQGLAVSVLDCGPGFPQAHAEQLFDAFHREDATRNTAPGFGLGLADCKRLAELQGGNIWALARPGGGSEFSFSMRRE